MPTDPWTLKEDDVLARTLYAEAGGEGFAGIMAVGLVILNRARSPVTWWGRSVKEVCLKSSSRGVHQFSCWNAGDKARNLVIDGLPDNLAGQYCAQIALMVLGDLAGQTPPDLYDFTEGSCHYHTKRVSPAWSRHRTPVLTLGNHLFFNDIP